MPATATLLGHVTLGTLLGTDLRQGHHGVLDATRERVSPFVQRRAVRALALLDVPGIRGRVRLTTHANYPSPTWSAVSCSWVGEGTPDTSEEVPWDACTTR